ncbi:class I SAM-dependent methyltransferase [Pseudomonas saponiphila]
MKFTGERFLPDVRGDIELEHIHRYLLAHDVIQGKDVLDIASGEGYGSAMLAGVARSVIGVDISPEAVSHANAKYQTSNVEFRLGSCSAIPLDDASVDVVVSFETIEHHDEHESMMQEIKRVLRPGGTLVISSPEKLEYSDKPGFKNPHHVKELYREEFKRLLDSYFTNHSMYGQRVLYGSVIACEDRESLIRSYELVDDPLTAKFGISHPIYLIAVASDSELPDLASGVFEQSIHEAELVQRLSASVSYLNNQIVGLNQVVTEQEAKIAAVYNSFSWRVTKPLRNFKRFLSGGRN